MEIKHLSVSLLQEYENNPRFNENAIDKVAESIKEFGFKVPIIVDKDNIIVAGHTRLKAAKQLGIETVPCIVADDLSPEQIKAFRLADNKVSEFSTWDEDKLYVELMELETTDFKVEHFGFETKEIGTPTTEDIWEEAATDPEPNIDTNFNYKEQYGVIVMCKDEQEQEKIYNNLVELGYECKVVAT